MAASSINQDEKIKLKNKELFTDSFNICKKLLIEEDYYLTDRENDSFSDLSIVNGHKMYKAMMLAMNSIITSNNQNDKIDKSNTILKRFPAKKKLSDNYKFAKHLDENDNDLFNANCKEKQVKKVVHHINNNQDNILFKKNDTTVDVIHPKKKFKPNEKPLSKVNKNQDKIIKKTNKISNDTSLLNDSLKDSKNENNKKTWNVKIPMNLIQSLEATQNNVLDTCESNQSNEIESPNNEQMNTFNNDQININDKKNTKPMTQLKKTFKNDPCNVDESDEKNKSYLNKSTENIDTTRITRTSAGLISQIKYYDEKKNIKAKFNKPSNKDNKNNYTDNDEKLNQNENCDNKTKTTVISQKKKNPTNEIKEEKNLSQSQDLEIDNEINNSEMMELLNEWVYNKCIDNYLKGEKITNTKIRSWGVEAKQELMFGHLRFSASDKWYAKFKGIYNISGKYNDLKIQPEFVNQKI